MSGVYPVWKNKFKIGTKGGESQDADMMTIAQLSTFSISIDGGIQDWGAMENEGWGSSMVTTKSLSISFSGKRCVGDPGNDYIERCAFGMGDECNSKFEWELPSGAKLKFDCVISVTNPGTGEYGDVAPLEFEVKSNGKPVFTPVPTRAAVK